MLLAEAQHRRQHSAFVSGRWGKITGARKCTGKKNEKKKKNQEKIGVTRVDTIGDAAELLSHNDTKTLYQREYKHGMVHQIPNFLSTLYWFGFCYISTAPFLIDMSPTPQKPQFIKHKRSKTPETIETRQKGIRCTAWCKVACSANSDHLVSESAPFQVLEI